MCISWACISQYMHLRNVYPIDVPLLRGPPAPLPFLFFLLRPSSTPPAGTAIPASQQQPPLLLRPSTHIPYGLRGRGEGVVSSSLLSQAHIPYGLRCREEGLVSSSSHV